MSDINCHPTHLPNPDAVTSSDDDAYYGMPYEIATHFKSKTIKLVIPGQWTGSVNQDGITMTSDTTTQPGNTIVTYHFSGTAGTTVPATLTSVEDPSDSYTMNLTYTDL
jgi:hypothetical protein